MATSSAHWFRHRRTRPGWSSMPRGALHSLEIVIGTSPARRKRGHELYPEPVGGRVSSLWCPQDNNDYGLFFAGATLLSQYYTGESFGSSAMSDKSGAVRDRRRVGS